MCISKKCPLISLLITVLKISMRHFFSAIHVRRQWTNGNGQCEVAPKNRTSG